MKKLFYLLAVLFTALTFASCDKNGNNSPSDPSDPSNPSDSSSPTYWAKCLDNGILDTYNSHYMILIIEPNNIWQMETIKGNERNGEISDVVLPNNPPSDAGTYHLTKDSLLINNFYGNLADYEIQTIDNESYLIINGTKIWKKVNVLWNTQLVQKSIIGTWKLYDHMIDDENSEYGYVLIGEREFAFDGKKAKISVATSKGGEIEDYVIDFPIYGHATAVYSIFTAKNGEQIIFKANTFCEDGIPVEDLEIGVIKNGEEIDRCGGLHTGLCRKVSNTANIN